MRNSVQDFSLANPIYRGATVSFYTVSAGVKTATLATLYAGLTGATTLANPQQLDSRGKFKQAVYIADPAIATVSGLTVPDHDTGIIQAVLAADSLAEVYDNFAAATGSSLIGFRQTGVGAAVRTALAKMRELVTPQDYGAVGDGASHPISDYYATLAAAQVDYPHALALTDEIDGLAIQSCLNLGIPFGMPNGKYITTYGLVWVDGSVLCTDNPAFFMADPANPPAVGTVVEIMYDGAVAANSFICRMSKVAVGTKPTSQADESETLRNAGIVGVYLNGNDKAEFGLYSARAGLGNLYHNVSVTGTKEHGMWFNEHWTCSMGNLFAFHNGGRGITIGQNTFSWTGIVAVNAVDINLLAAYKNGLDLAAWTTADYEEGYGIGLYLGRSCNVGTIVSEWNSGVGVVDAPTSGGVTIQEIYVENNCHTLPTSAERFQVWYQSGVSSFYHMISGIYGLFNAITPSGNTNAPRLKIAGTAPGPVSSTYGQDVPVFDRVGFGTVIDADHGVYKLTNQALDDTIRIVSHYPQYGEAESISTTQTTLYVDDAATGTGSGINVSNYMVLADALNVARIVSSITTIDVSAMTTTAVPSASLVLDGTGFTRDLAIVGGGTGRFNNAATNIAATIQNWDSELTISGMVLLERSYIKNSSLSLYDIPTIRSGPNADADGALNIDGSEVQIGGTSVINVSNSTAATKIGIIVEGNSHVTFDNAAAGTMVSFTAGNAIHFNQGSGIVRCSLTTATATWAAAANVVRNTGGAGGMILAPDGLNP